MIGDEDDEDEDGDGDGDGDDADPVVRRERRLLDRLWERYGIERIDDFSEHPFGWLGREHTDDVVLQESEFSGAMPFVREAVRYENEFRETGVSLPLYGYSQPWSTPWSTIDVDDDDVATLFLDAICEDGERRVFAVTLAGWAVDTVEVSEPLGDDFAEVSFSTGSFSFGWRWQS